MTQGTQSCNAQPARHDDARGHDAQASACNQSEGGNSHCQTGQAGQTGQPGQTSNPPPPQPGGNTQHQADNCPPPDQNCGGDAHHDSLLTANIHADLGGGNADIAANVHVADLVSVDLGLDLGHDCSLV